ncbi:MAG: 4-hydroxybenzoate octaprenyltransferase [Proteobacteria bacterium]|nr:4-hydroxybenzoate octaprenyltransferase [Pseudomonadota bacterium]
MISKAHLENYFKMMRFDRPIGFILLLFPAITALWIAGYGFPDPIIMVIFILGAFTARAAGSVINDYLDRNFDGLVERTKERPLALGKITEKETLFLFFALGFISLLLAFMLNTFTFILALIAGGLTVLYPLLKRVTHLPQVGLGIVWSFGILMAFSVTRGELPGIAWLLYFTNLLLTFAYDTMYAMSDMPDDLQIGVKSTAILFGKYASPTIGIFQLVVLALLILIGNLLSMQIYYYFSLLFVAMFFGYQQWLINQGNREYCFKAFLNNQWVVLVIFIGVLSGYH